MPVAKAGDVELFYETFGKATDEPLLLIMGLGAQMTSWHEGFCKLLARNGFFVIRYDNRDAGLSTRFENGPVPNPVAVLLGDHSSLSYRLEDLAGDAAGLLDALSVDSAHVVGASMGGMVAQLMAIHHPARVRSLVSIMSTTGDPSVGRASEEMLALMFAPSLPASPEDELDRMFTMRTAMASPKYPTSERQTRAFVEAAHERAYYPHGTGRQLVAILAATDRTAALAGVRAPTLVIHGSDDPLINVSGGEATAKAIPGAELMVVDGMSHDLPSQLWPQFVEAITSNAGRGTDG